VDGSEREVTTASATIAWILRCAAALTTLAIACAQPVSAVRLQAEQVSVVHVDQTALLTVPSAGEFSIGSAGTALTLISRHQRDGRTIYTYQAVRPGDQTFIATPKEPGPDGCVSCMTVRYFVKVVP
jgi:hypothetical protein